MRHATEAAQLKGLQKKRKKREREKEYWARCTWQGKAERQGTQGTRNRAVTWYESTLGDCKIKCSRPAFTALPSHGKVGNCMELPLRIATGKVQTTSRRQSMFRRAPGVLPAPRSVRRASPDPPHGHLGSAPPAGPQRRSPAVRGGGAHGAAPRWARPRRRRRARFKPPPPPPRAALPPAPRLGAAAARGATRSGAGGTNGEAVGPGRGRDSRAGRHLGKGVACGPPGPRGKRRSGWAEQRQRRCRHTCGDLQGDGGTFTGARGAQKLTHRA